MDILHSVSELMIFYNYVFTKFFIVKLQTKVIFLTH